jgi:hypothetical protein
VGVIENPTQDLALVLFDTVRELNKRIQERAREIADPQIAAVRAECAARTAELERQHKWAIQRAEDLLAEMRRQLAAQDRMSTRYRKFLIKAGIDPLTGVRRPVVGE